MPRAAPPRPTTTTIRRGWWVGRKEGRRERESKVDYIISPPLRRGLTRHFVNVKSFIDPRRCHPPSYPRDLPPTRDSHRTTPRHPMPALPPSLPPTVPIHPPEHQPATRRLKGADPYSAKRIYMPGLAHVEANVCTCADERCARAIERENFETNDRFIYLLGPLFRSFSARTRSDFLRTCSRESLCRGFRRGKPSSALAALVLVAAD